MVSPGRVLRCLTQCFVAVSVVVFSIAIVRALLAGKPRRPPHCKSTDKDYMTDTGRNLSQRLAHALTIKTIIWAGHTYDGEPLLELHRYIRESFPLVHSSPLVQREVIANYSLLYVVPGSNPELKPYMLCGHMDVVPASEDNWKHPPFSGRIIDGAIWGRGSLDAKHIVMHAGWNYKGGPSQHPLPTGFRHMNAAVHNALTGSYARGTNLRLALRFSRLERYTDATVNSAGLSGVLEALEFLLERGHRPRRTLYIAFGHDEEEGGLDGASTIGKVLAARGLQFEYILDEGLLILNSTFPGVETPLAMIGVTEKGLLTFKVTAYGTAVYAAVPPPETAIVTLAKALVRFHSHAHPNLYGTGVEVKMMSTIGRFAPFWMKLLLVNAWLFRPIVARLLSMSRIADSFVRTTSAVTIAEGGVKDTIAPSEAYGIINQRIHPQHTVEEAMEYNRYLVRDLNVTVEAMAWSESPPVSPYDSSSFGYATIEHTLYQMFAEVAVIPEFRHDFAAFCMGNTDTRHYLGLSRAIYRFSPLNLEPSQTNRVHGANERITLRNYEVVVNFYRRLIQNSDVDHTAEHTPNSGKSGDL